jgi:SSS family solute:Na+ symporter
MSIIDYVIFAVYMICVMGVGIYYFLRNENREDYYVGGRSIHATHVGLSIVATDVGGGFSIGLGGVGFAMGLSGSWLLFTGLVGAWLCAVFIIPRIKKLDAEHSFMTYPDFLRFRYGEKVAVTAAIISGMGYLGFTGGQMLAGAKLAAATIFQTNPFGMDPIQFSLLLIAVITVLYTVLGGLKAVIYTDTIQWIVLLAGLIFVTVPVTVYKIGGLSTLTEKLPESYFTLTNITGVQFINWMVTIIPIWLIGMTLYQRMYACKDEAEAKKAWYIAGIFEYPIMAFTGVFLGMCARTVFPEADAEMALPMLIRDVLPVGVTGIVIASYFSAIMSTADSCLMASSGNFLNDIIERFWLTSEKARETVKYSMLVTFLVGVMAVLLASQFTMVLDAILYAYAFMVSGLFIPTLAAYFWDKGSSSGAMMSMLGGGTLTLLLQFKVFALPEKVQDWGFDTSLYGIAFSLLLFLVFSFLMPDEKAELAEEENENMPELAEN